MSKSTYPLKMLRSVKQAAAQLAKADGVSLNQLIASAVAEKVGSLKSADIFLAERAGRAQCTNLLRYLRKAPKATPVRGDERPK
jgi:hypothetical protein